MMAKDVRLLTEYSGALRSFVWISLLDDGAVSVGLLDKSFRVPALASEMEIDGKVHTQVTDLRIAHGVDAISNPHFTFHPSAYYHLRANDEAELFSGLLMVDLVLESEGVLPWIRAVSNPVRNLKPFEQAPPGRTIEVIRLQMPNEDQSVSLEIDFVVPNTKIGASPKDLFLECGERLVRVRAFNVEPQRATLWWNHSS